MLPALRRKLAAQSHVGLGRRCSCEPGRANTSRRPIFPPHHISPLSKPQSQKANMSKPSISLTHAFTMTLTVGAPHALPGTPVGDRCKFCFIPRTSSQFDKLTFFFRVSLHPGHWRHGQGRRRRSQGDSQRRRLCHRPRRLRQARRARPCHHPGWRAALHPVLRSPRGHLRRRQEYVLSPHKAIQIKH